MIDLLTALVLCANAVITFAADGAAIECVIDRPGLPPISGKGTTAPGALQEAVAAGLKGSS